ncbi:universal stress protein [Kutzneria viridogrisea]|uniref:UspA domain-containing protein n=2 Tax=Kutzneria TaxID=43356 RepID=W5W8V7_9PSEU|nr:universal stress protein [Kutzneria albida]AHH96991.1 hypothetical protein KALB_3627 [Kutzneria albida DSM 43870]MBA8932044.1 nucleotide-binding universal stress UspA family protein [Kutzneria viridogrisea]
MGARMIVVGVDWSRSSLGAVRWALAESQRRDCEVEAVTAWQADPLVTGPPPIVEPGHRLSQAVEAVCGPGAPAVPVREVLLPGWAPEVLEERSRYAELLVLGRRGYTRLTGKLLGSVTAHCVQHAHCPVAIVPAPVEHRPEPLG